LDDRTFAARLILLLPVTQALRPAASAVLAGVGDVILTRNNHRRLRLGGSDWVKNGGRWTITHIGWHGDLTVRHTRSHLTARLPGHYVAESAELGYATTIHAAQGVTADTMHGLVTGQESRQQLYTMLTRGRAANYLYLQVVGDGDPHSVIRPELVSPRTPTETLEQILARDEAPTSATTQLRELSDPAGRHHQAVLRYTDGLHLAAEHLIGPRTVAALDHQADQVVPGVTDEPAWPTLRADLIALAADTRQHPLAHLHLAALGRDLSTAGDMAAVLDWRLPEPAPTHNRAPLPWLRGIPKAIQDHPEWGDYLTQRTRLINDLAEDVRHRALRDGTQPAWTPPGRRLSATLIGDIEVRRAANGVNPHDYRPTGPPQLQTASIEWRQRFEHTIAQAADDSAHLDPARREAAPTTVQGRGPDNQTHTFHSPHIHGRPMPPGPGR
jgi:hypothetical protein